MITNAIKMADRRPSSNLHDMRTLLAHHADDGFVISVMLAQDKCRLHPDLDPREVYRGYGIIESDGPA